MAFKKSNFVLLQIIEWLINSAAYTSKSAGVHYLCFELPAFNVLDEAIVLGRLDYALGVELNM